MPASPHPRAPARPFCPLRRNAACRSSVAPQARPSAYCPGPCQRQTHPPAGNRAAARSHFRCRRCFAAPRIPPGCDRAKIRYRAPAARPSRPRPHRARGNPPPWGSRNARPAWRTRPIGRCCAGTCPGRFPPAECAIASAHGSRSNPPAPAQCPPDGRARRPPRSIAGPDEN